MYSACTVKLATGEEPQKWENPLIVALVIIEIHSESFTVLCSWFIVMVNFQVPQFTCKVSVVQSKRNGWWPKPLLSFVRVYINKPVM